MVRRHIAIEQAYVALGLENDASCEEVKATYRKLAMKTHPDRNPDVPDATQKFQEVGAAYNTLMKHFDRLESPPEYQRGYQQSDYSDEEYDYDDDYYDEDEPSEFYFFVFDEFSRGSYHGILRSGFSPYEQPRAWCNAETEEQYEERMCRNRQEIEEARQRRAAEEEQRRERIKLEKEHERVAAEQRQKQRIKEKKVQAEAAKQKAVQKVRSQQERTQCKRSALFAAARRGDSEAVKKGVWEDSVDAAGGEVKPDSEAFVPQAPEDPAETLLHIAADRGDVELVEWLVNHNAETEERNSAGLTALHVALKKGHIPVVQYFFNNFPPKDAEYESIYETPASTDLLQLAIIPFEPELVWMVLEKKLATKRNISEAWSSVCSSTSAHLAKENLASGKRGIKDAAEREEEIKNLLMTYGGFTPPPTPKKEASNITTEAKKPKSTRPRRPVVDSTEVSPILQSPTPTASPVPSNNSQQTAPTFSNGNSSYSKGGGQTRAPGRGQRRGRGHGRGQR